MARLARLVPCSLIMLAVAGCPDDGRKSGAEGIADAYDQLGEFECQCVAEQYGGGQDLVDQCQAQLQEYEGEFSFPFECIDRAVSGNSQAEAVFECAVSATYDYVDCLVAEGCPEQFSCADGSTYTETDKCDGFEDCADGADEMQGCMTEPFTCADGTELYPTDVCDGFEDCEGGEDEAADCPETCDSVFEDAATRCGEVPASVEAEIEKCFPTYACADGTLVDDGAECDGFSDCPDGSDEASCGSTRDVGRTARRAMRVR